MRPEAEAAAGLKLNDRNRARQVTARSSCLYCSSETSLYFLLIARGLPARQEWRKEAFTELLQQHTHKKIFYYMSRNGHRGEVVAGVYRAVAKVHFRLLLEHKAADKANIFNLTWPYTSVETNFYFEERFC